MAFDSRPRKFATDRQRVSTWRRTSLTSHDVVAADPGRIPEQHSMIG